MITEQAACLLEMVECVLESSFPAGHIRAVAGDQGRSKAAILTEAFQCFLEGSIGSSMVVKDVPALPHRIQGMRTDRVVGRERFKNTVEVSERLLGISPHLVDVAEIQVDACRKEILPGIEQLEAGTFAGIDGFIDATGLAEWLHAGHEGTG